jgi:hypothetical protein
MEHTLQNQPVNIITSICEFLSIDDTFALVLTCKRIYSIRSQIAISREINFYDSVEFMLLNVCVTSLFPNHRKYRTRRQKHLEPLIKLNKAGYYYVSDDVFSYIRVAFTNVVKLTFDSLAVSKEDYLSYDNLHNLREIELRDCRVESIMYLPSKIMRLSLINCTYKNMFHAQLNDKLEELSIHNLMNHLGKNSRFLRRGNPQIHLPKNLKVLNVVGCDFEVPDVNDIFLRSDKSKDTIIIDSVIEDGLNKLEKFTFTPDLLDEVSVSESSIVYAFVRTSQGHFQNIKLINISGLNYQAKILDFSESKAEEMMISGSKFRSLTLPRGLKRLHLQNNIAESLCILPEKLEKLICVRDKVFIELGFQNYPDSLKYIELIGSYEEDTYDIVATLEKLETLKINTCSMIRCLNLPPNIQYLEILETNVAVVGALPNHLKSAKITYKMMTDCYMNRIKRISDSFTITGFETTHQRIDYYRLIPTIKFIE